MQIYKEISILTSKPNLNDTKIINHHLYGIHSVRNKFSTGHWLKMALIKIDQIWKSKKVPVIVGGTGLYFKALTDGLVKIPVIPTNIKTEIKKLHSEIGQALFFKQLNDLDSLTKKFISPTDVQRSIRAYEVKKFTNRSLFNLIKETKSNFNDKIFKKLFINTPKPVLHNTIENRVEKMFQDGVIEEVKSFLKMNIYRELSANKIIGIKEIREYLRGKETLKNTKEIISQKTRQYVKRQFTWSRGHMKSWEMIYSSNIKDLFEKAINKIS